MEDYLFAGIAGGITTALFVGADIFDAVRLRHRIKEVEKEVGKENMKSYILSGDFPYHRISVGPIGAKTRWDILKRYGMDPWKEAYVLR